MITTSHYSNSLALNSVHIIGLGWLGLPLLNALTNRGLRVSGTVTTKEKQQGLHKKGLDVDIFDMYQAVTDPLIYREAVAKQRFKNNSLVVNIAPGRGQFKKDKYIASMTRLIDKAMEAGLNRLVFISTTSVYGKQTGTIENDSELSPITESAIAHMLIENHLMSNYSSKVKILRSSGLVGPNRDDSLRHPIFTLCHKKDIVNGSDPVNLVHQADLIQAIIALLEIKTNRIAYNIAAPEHPSRKEYYTWCAKQLDLPIPEFMDDVNKRQLGKLIDARDTFNDLHISAKYTSPFDMLSR